LKPIPQSIDMPATPPESSPRCIGIVAALESDVMPLVREWPVRRAEHAGRKFKFFESEKAVVVCGGIGKLGAAACAKVLVIHYSPKTMISCGLAGSLKSDCRAGEVLEAARVIDVSAAKSYATATGTATLLTVSRVLGVEEKRRLAEKYSAQAVDMEAAAVAEVAAAAHLPFMAIKAISDELDFPMPPMDRFINGDGSFATARFAVYAALRPMKWPGVIRLARNSALASRNLCSRLQSLIDNQEFTRPAIKSRGLSTLE